MLRWIVIGLILLVVVVWLAVSSIIFVDQAEYVYVTQFGQHVATYDGQTDAGLHFKLPWPIQSVLRVDRRLQVFDVPTQELLIHDRGDKPGEEKMLTLTFDVYVCWRIADPDPAKKYDSVDLFVRTFGTPEKAQNFLRSQIISRLKMGLGDVYLAQLVNTDPGQVKTDDLMQSLKSQPYKLSSTDSAEQPASLMERARAVGIEIEDIRLRRFNHPLQVRDEVFAKIREDRRREANKYRNEGELSAEQIRARGRLQAKTIQAEADAYKVRTEGQARADAADILNEAHQLAPDFYRTVRLLESYKQMFGDGKTQLILSLDHPLLALFKDLPRRNGSAVGGGPGTKPSPGTTPGGNGGRKEMPPP